MHWLKRYGSFDIWVDFAYWWSKIGGGFATSEQDGTYYQISLYNFQLKYKHIHKYEYSSKYSSYGRRPCFYVFFLYKYLFRVTKAGQFLAPRETSANIYHQ